MNARVTMVTGAGLGAGLMYLLDPEQGDRRRALIRDQVARLLRRTGRAAGVTARDVRHRTGGLLAEWRGRFAEHEVGDETLVQRVRSTMGRAVSHPRALDVTAAGGQVTLSGPVLRDEVRSLLSAVSRVRGVRQVHDRLEPHDRAEGVPALQGGLRRTGERQAFMQEVWSPTTRALAGATGVGLALYGAKRRDGVGALLALAGVGLLLRAVTNLGTPRLAGAGAGRRAVDIRKSITVDAPVDAVYAFWDNYENFPGFMANVRQIEGAGDRCRWTVKGPGGVDLDFDAVVTRREPNRCLAWETVPGSAVDHGGEVVFQPNADGTTTAHVRFSYNPPAGAVGHAVAWLFGADPKREMDEDLARMKRLVEQQGRASGTEPGAPWG